MRWVAMVMVALVVAGSCSDDGASDEAMEGFSFAADDLCEWVTEKDVAGFVAAEFDWDGIATLDTSWESEDVECWWVLSDDDGDSGEVIAGNAAKWETFSGDPVRLDQRPVVDHEDAEMGQWISDHPALNEDVVALHGGFGSFAFSVVNHSEYLSLSVQVGDEARDWDEFEPRFFGVANDFIERLGWSRAGPSSS